MKKPEKKEFPDEFTEAMHATFWVTEEEDREHRVWAAMEMFSGGWPGTIEEAVALTQVTMANYEKYKDTYPLPG